MNDEGSVDATCGSNGAGELSPTLAQVVGVSASCAAQPTVDDLARVQSDRTTWRYLLTADDR